MKFRKPRRSKRLIKKLKKKYSIRNNPHYYNDSADAMAYMFAGMRKSND